MLRYAFRSHQGCIREKNEDRFFVPSKEGEQIFAVADGMGGHVGGEIASSLTIDILNRHTDDLLDFFPHGDLNKMQELLKSIVIEANNNILDKQRQQPELHGMGTTFTVAVFWGKTLLIGHVGDSQVHLFNDTGHFQITKDHSLVMELLRTGKIKNEEVSSHPQRHVLTRALGISSLVEVDLYVRDINDGDLFLLCTDGLTNMLLPDEIGTVIRQNDDLEVAADRLLETANERGGLDNITFIIVHIL